MTTPLTVLAAVQTPSGWIELEDEDNGYTLHSESFASRAVEHRVVSGDGEWIDGTYAMRSTKGNIVEPVSIWVDGFGDHFVYATKMKALKDAFDQRAFAFRVQFGNMLETWTCTMPADYTEQTEQAARFSTVGYLQVQVAHLPNVAITEVAP